MDPTDWIMVGFAVTAVLLSVACRWQRSRDDREWAEFHAPLSQDESDTRLDITLQEAKSSSLPCSMCGFQNFSTKIICVMCHTRLAVNDRSIITTAPSVRLKHTRGLKADTKTLTTIAPRSRSTWSRKVDVQGRLYWYCNANSTEWSEFIVQISTQQASVGTFGEATVATVDPSTCDPTASFSSAWHQAVSMNQHQAQQLLHVQQQPFPARVAEYTARLLIQPTTSDELTALNLHRETLLSETIKALAPLAPPQLQGPLRVGFLDEPGIDAGGVYREWISLFSEQLVYPDAHIFTCVDVPNQRFYLSLQTRDSQDSRAIGRFIGRVLRSGDTLGFHLAPPLLKLILGEPLGFHDLAKFDPELHRHLQWLAQHDGADALGLDFTVIEPSATGGFHIVELVPGGRDVAVTDLNKREYIEQLTRYRLVHSVSTQLAAFLQGIYDVVPLEDLVLFTSDELDYLLSGSDMIDVDDWERNTRYTEDLWHHPTRFWFWEIVRAMPPELQQRLLQFATGASRVPVVGFRGLTSVDGRLAPFTLVGRPLCDEGFVRSHACFNRLDVPLYVNKRHLERGLYALLETDVYGFSTA